MKVYQHIAMALSGFVYNSRDDVGDYDKAEMHQDRLVSLVKEHLPSGSGFDAGTGIDLCSSHADRIVLTTSFHHMDEVGGYDGWTKHTITVTPSLAHGIVLRATGRDRNGIRVYIGDVFYDCLTKEI